MDHITRCWIAGTTVALLSINGSQAQSVPTDVIVRLYNIARLPHGEIVAAKGVAEKIFRGIGIQLRWRDCAPNNDFVIAGDSCMERVGPRELIGRIAAGGQNVSSRVFGQAIVMKGTHTSTIATIFADRIGAVAARLDIDRGPLVGRTLAHELGHLLLGTNSHGAFGLMRGMWADAVIRSQSGREWNFSNREAQQIKLALVRRTDTSLLHRDLQVVTAPSARDPS